jgi:hypothetical protein
VLTKPWESSELLKTLSLLAVDTNTLQGLHTKKDFRWCNKVGFYYISNFKLVLAVFDDSILDKARESTCLLSWRC